MWWLWAAYANDSNAQHAQTKVANYLRQSGIAAQTQIMKAQDGCGLLCWPWNNPAKACCGVYAKDRTKMLGD